MNHQNRRSQRGVTIIIFALALPVIAFLTFGILQVSNTSTQAMSLQENADAAALAGAREIFNYIDAIPSDPDFATRTQRVQERVEDYIRVNNPEGNIVASDIQVDWQLLTVSVSLEASQQAMTQLTEDLATNVSAAATAELVIPEMDWCFGVDISQAMLFDPSNPDFNSGNLQTPVGQDPRAIVNRMVEWLQRMDGVPVFRKNLAYSLVPYGNAVNVGVHHLDRFSPLRNDGRTYQEVYHNRQSLDPDSPIFVTHANSCRGCTDIVNTCPQCEHTPSCLVNAGVDCFAQYVDEFVEPAAVQDAGLSVGCVLERRNDDPNEGRPSSVNFFNDTPPTSDNEKFIPMVTFFETGCSSGHMYCLPPVSPLVAQGNPTFAQPINLGAMEMWDVPTTPSEFTAPIQFDQLPMFQQGLVWCHRTISPQWDGLWNAYNALPDFSTFSGKGVVANYGQIGDIVRISPERKKIITMFMSGFENQVSPDKVRVALSDLDRTAYSESPYLAGNIELNTRLTCDYIREQRYGARQQNINVNIVNSNPTGITNSERDLLTTCATYPDDYIELANPNIDMVTFRAIMRKNLDTVVATRLIR